MKRLGSFFTGILPHITLILSLLMLTFYTIDLFNESMSFLNNVLTKSLLLVFSCLSLILSVLTIVSRHNKP